MAAVTFELLKPTTLAIIREILGRKYDLVLKLYIVIVGTSVLNNKPHSFHINDVLGYNLLRGAIMAPLRSFHKIVTACSRIGSTG